VQEKSVNHAGLSRKPSRFSVPHEEDIPEALREGPIADSQLRFSPMTFLWGGIGLGAIALSTGIFVWWQQPAARIPASPKLVQPRPEPLRATTGLQESTSLLGHFSYQEAPPNTLQPIVADGSIKLRQAAAEKFLAMVQAAKAAGVTLVPVSGFRSIADQEYLFFDLKAQQGNRATERAAVSAPPGYSEHHTGYAIDILDGTRPDTNLETSFETTPAFRWLQANAAHFSFELSFPKDNPQGVSYEPWHWRFVGDRDSLETFYRARTFTSEPTAQPEP
jgi:zinc D-Ala-D-Ala carboxypeptidase